MKGVTTGRHLRRFTELTYADATKKATYTPEVALFWVSYVLE